MADELDFLGLYLENGFNFVIPEKDMLFTVAGMSSPIDRYYEALNIGAGNENPRDNVVFTRKQIHR